MPNRTANEIMTRSLVTFRPDTGIYEAVRTLISRKISGAPVIDDERRLVGILSEKDCFRVLTTTAFEGNPEGKVRDYMTAQPKTVSPETSFYEIVSILQREAFRRLPVVDRRGRLVGQISRRDVLTVIESMADNPFLFGVEDNTLDRQEVGGVHTAMQRARAQ